jgi:MoxR-like ATPase
VVVGDLIGEGSAQEQSVVDETPNLAARLQALAEPDAVVIAAGTRRLVGRDEEIDLLTRLWVHVEAGKGRVVLISGEPGLGKSRITAPLEERLHGEPHLRLHDFLNAALPPQSAIKLIP